MPSKRVRSTTPMVGGGGGSVTVAETFTDAFSLGLSYTTEAAAAPTDVDEYVLSLAQADSNTAPVDTVSLAFPAPDFADTATAPAETDSFTMRVWLSASAGASVTNPANADGANDATVATLQTAVAGSAALTMTSTLGANVPAGISVASAVYRGWFKSVNTLITSHGDLVMHSTSALFTDITMFTNAALNTTVDHLTGDFTFDLVAAGVNTAAKLGSCQMLHKVTDAAAGVTPHVLTVDAGCIEIAGAFT